MQIQRGHRNIDAYPTNSFTDPVRRGNDLEDDLKKRPRAFVDSRRYIANLTSTYNLLSVLYRSPVLATADLDQSLSHFIGYSHSQLGHPIGSAVLSLIRF